MAANFKIMTHHTPDRLIFRLIGDFDGDSACQLLNLLKRYSPRKHDLVVDTNCLQSVFPFGANLFRHRLDIGRRKFNNVVFTGLKAGELNRTV